MARHEPETSYEPRPGPVFLPAKGSEGPSAGSPSWPHSRDRVAATRRRPKVTRSRCRGPRRRARRDLGSSTGPATSGSTSLPNAVPPIRPPSSTRSARASPCSISTATATSTSSSRPGARSRRQGRLRGGAVAVPKRRARPLGRRLGAFGPTPHRLGARRGRVRLRRRRRPRPLRRAARPRHPLAEPGDGTFRDVTKAAGISDKEWGVSATWGDYDADGWPDLYVTNYLDVDALHPPEPIHYYGGDTMVFRGPEYLEGQPDRLWRNRGRDFRGRHRGPPASTTPTARGCRPSSPTSTATESSISS